MNPYLSVPLKALQSLLFMGDSSMLHVHCSLLDRADLHVFQTRFVIGWKTIRMVT